MHIYFRNKCVLPPQIKFGRWEIQRGESSLGPGTLVSSGTALEITCDKKSQLIGKQIILCKNGKWSAEIGQCLSKHLTEN